jgi:hypothetical protein
MALLTETKAYADEASARAYADDFRKNFWGYDGQAHVYHCKLTDRWVVSASRYSSCD